MATARAAMAAPSPTPTFTAIDGFDDDDDAVFASVGLVNTVAVVAEDLEDTGLVDVALSTSMGKWALKLAVRLVLSSKQ